MQTTLHFLEEGTKILAIIAAGELTITVENWWEKKNFSLLTTNMNLINAVRAVQSILSSFIKAKPN